MITREQFSQELLNNTSIEFIEILEQFANTTLAVYGDVIDEKTLIERLQNVHCICFDDDSKACKRLADDVNGECGCYQVLINSKLKDKPIDYLKSLIYHELVHSISDHEEIDEDLYYSGKRVRPGLNREIIVPKYAGGDDVFNEGNSLDEIMTEFYANQLLMHDGIDLSGEWSIKNYALGAQDFVDYKGSGYMDYSNLGQIYDLFFGKQLLAAKIFDGNQFRSKFNELFGNAKIFDGLFTEEGPYLSAYSKFVAQTGIQERYETACKIFMVLLKNKYKDEHFDERKLAHDETLDKFMGMLIKSRDYYNADPKVKYDLFLLIQDLQKEISFDMLGAGERANMSSDSDITTCVYMAYKKILEVNPNVKLKDLQYRTFNLSQFEGVIVCDGNTKYLINAKLLGQDMPVVSFQTMTEDIVDSFKRSGIDFSNSEFATLHSSLGIQSIIFKDGEYFDHYGHKIETSLPINMLGDGTPLQKEDEMIK